jgi:hypothetical protein
VYGAALALSTVCALAMLLGRVELLSVRVLRTPFVWRR